MRETFCCKQEVVKGASDRDRFFTSLRPFCSNDLDSVVVTQKEGQSLHSFHFAPHTLVVVAACLPACLLANQLWERKGAAEPEIHCPLG